MTSVVDLCASSALLASTLIHAWPDRSVFRAQMVLVALAISPTVYKMYTSLVKQHNPRKHDYTLWSHRFNLESLASYEHRREIQLGFLQPVRLFPFQERVKSGSAQWILAKWTENEEALRVQQAEAIKKHRARHGPLGTFIMRSGGDYLFLCVLFRLTER